jgi:hypothetical protein
LLKGEEVQQEEVGRSGEDEMEDNERIYEQNRILLDQCRKEL